MVYYLWHFTNTFQRTDGGLGMIYNSDELVQYLSLSNLAQMRYAVDADAL